MTKAGIEKIVNETPLKEKNVYINKKNQKGTSHSYFLAFSKTFKDGKISLFK